MTATAAVAPPLPREAEAAGRRFYVRTAIGFIAVAMLGFAPTYWLPVARGTLHVAPIVHIHAALFFGWTFFFLAQTMLVASDNERLHREVGVAGVSLATAMCLVGFGVAINSIKRLDAAGFGPAGRAFSLIAFSAIVVFAVLIGLALLNVKRPEIHKRLLLIATASLLPAAIGRWFALFLAPPNAVPGAPPPAIVTLAPNILADLFIVGGMIYDRRTRGRVHPVYWIAGGALLVVEVVRIPLSGTGAWLRVTDWLVALSP
jgi:hypothetical protein